MTAPRNHQPPVGPSGSQEPIRFGRDDHGRPVVFHLTPTGPPYMLVTGGSGTGLTRLIHVIARAAAARGIDVRVCSPNITEAEDLRDLPGLTVATSLPDIIRLIEDTATEMGRRYQAISTGQTDAAEYQGILLTADDIEQLNFASPEQRRAAQDSRLWPGVTR